MWSVYILSAIFVNGALCFYMYYVLAWGIYNGEDTVLAWGTVYGIRAMEGSQP